PKIKDGKLRMRIFLDVSSAEVFFNDGECVMTGNIYAGAEDNGIALFGEGGTARITFINKYDLIV
ncbi:MAG: GH32 C-terminal domain-containing protein, partial [Clostridiales bacterium]|nr:GH32 C-terminal domain-containing protein [Clostridiales bacterium]